MSFGTDDLSRRWQGLVVPYEINDADFPVGSRGRAGVVRVILAMNAAAGVRMVPSTGQPDRVAIVRVNDRGFVNYIGRKRGLQHMHLPIADLGIGVAATYADSTDAQVTLVPDRSLLTLIPDIFLVAWSGTPNQAINIGRIALSAPGVMGWKSTSSLVTTGSPAVFQRRTFDLIGPSKYAVAVAYRSMEGRIEFGQTGFRKMGLTPGDLQPLEVTGLAEELRIATSSPAVMESGLGHLVSWADGDGRIVVAELDRFNTLTLLAHLTDATEVYGPTPGRDSAHGPALASHEGSTYLAWLGEDARVTIAVDPVGDGSFGVPFVTTWSSTSRPTMASINVAGALPELHMVWHSEDAVPMLGQVNTHFPTARPLHDLWQIGWAHQLRSVAPMTLVATGVDTASLLSTDQDQRINLSNLWVRDDSVMWHETGHLLGLHHEQCRPDRGAFVIIDERDDDDDLDEDAQYEVKDGTMFGPYDLKSVMHYLPDPPPFPRMAARPPNVIAPSSQFSVGDVVGLRYLCPIRNVAVINESSDDPPALWFSPRSFDLSIAWRGAGNDQLNVGRLELGVRSVSGATPPPEPAPGQAPIPGHWIEVVGNLFDKHTLAEASDCGPAGTWQALAYRGSGNDALNLAELMMGKVAQKWVLPDRSDLAPAVVAMTGGYLLAWVGDNEAVNLAAFSWTGNYLAKLVTPLASECTPALVRTGPAEFVLGWKGSGNDNLNVVPVSLAPPTISLGPVTTLPMTCDEDTSPALAFLRGRVVLGWTGNETYLNFATSIDGGRTFGKFHTSGERSHCSPALAVVGARSDSREAAGVAVAWTGTDGGHLNVGILDLDWM